MDIETKEKIKEITKEILLTIGAVGFVFVLITCPGIGYLFKDSFRKKRYPEKNFKQSLRKLKKEQLILIEKKGKQTVIKLSEKGKRKLLRYKLEELKINKYKKWDGWWRIVVFDIPEKKRLARDALRRKLRELNFYKLQKSIFVYPYDCKEVIDFIKILFEIDPYVNLILAKSIENEQKIKKFFKLK